MMFVSLCLFYPSNRVQDTRNSYKLKITNFWQKSQKNKKKKKKKKDIEGKKK